MTKEENLFSGKSSPKGSSEIGPYCGPSQCFSGVSSNAPWSLDISSTAERSDCSLDIFAADRADIKPGVEGWIAAQRLNRLAQVL